MANVYCNLTTDLHDVFPGIGQYQRKDIVEDWTLVSGQSNTYQSEGVGYVEQVFDDGVQLTVQTSIANVESNAGSYYYNSDVDILYVHQTGGGDPANSVIESGVDWDTFKTRMRAKAMQTMDSYLARRYIVPIVPRSIQTHDTSEHEYIIVRICALLVCAYIIGRVDPANVMGTKLFREAINFAPEVDESKGLINQLMDGDAVLQNQRTPQEAGWIGEIIPDSSNTINETPILTGVYEGGSRNIWRLQIDTAGVIGTATWKVSFDGGTNWDLTLKDTHDSNNDKYRFHIARGVYVEWPDVTWVEGEFWDIHLYPADDSVEMSKIGFSTICR